MRMLTIDSTLRKKLMAALVTRYSPNDPQRRILIATALKYIPASVHQWGQAHIHDSGNHFECCRLLKGQQHTHDCTHVKVVCLLSSLPLQH